MQTSFGRWRAVTIDGAINGHRQNIVVIQRAFVSPGSRDGNAFGRRGELNSWSSSPNYHRVDAVVALSQSDRQQPFHSSETTAVRHGRKHECHSANAK